MHQSQKIARLNDRFRKTFVGGHVSITRSVAALGILGSHQVLQAVRDFDEFTADNDPAGEHGRGALTIGEHALFWRIDYYDLTLTQPSTDPADPAVTTRVLTIMCAEEARER